MKLKEFGPQGGEGGGRSANALLCPISRKPRVIKEIWLGAGYVDSLNPSFEKIESRGVFGKDSQNSHTMN